MIFMDVEETLSLDPAQDAPASGEGIQTILVQPRTCRLGGTRLSRHLFERGRRSAFALHYGHCRAPQLLPPDVAKLRKFLGLSLSNCDLKQMSESVVACPRNQIQKRPASSGAFLYLAAG
ncbi:hypothetical protein ASC75_13375 [Aminobacter sp. DSM 101952]|nr:hypothetical protein ASC75_13375 [Aminobacter sp. DSM 101952]